MDNNNGPVTLADLRKQFKPIINPNEVTRQKLAGMDKVAFWITKKVGTMGFFLIIFGWTVFWLGWNTLGPKPLRFDPYPGFVLWLFLSNMIQIFLMPLIMIGQNLQGNHSEARAEADFQVNTQSEKEIETILMHLENQNQMILEILEKLKKEKPKVGS